MSEVMNESRLPSVTQDRIKITTGVLIQIGAFLKEFFEGHVLIWPPH